MAEYRCIRKCQHKWETEQGMKSRIYNVDDILNHSGPVIPCPECEKGKVKNEEGKMEECFKCKGTARSVPSHHFMPMNGEVRQEPESEESELDKVRAEFVRLGAAFDKRWNLTTLKNRLVMFKKEQGI
jgi:hypothetical protein